MELWTREKITEVVASRLNGRWPRDPKAYNEIYQGVCRAKRVETYYGLMDVFIVSPNNLGSQTLAGRLLNSINKKTCEDAKQLLSRILETWNVSAEELVWYCAKQYGKQNLFAEIQMLKPELKSGRSLAALNSFIFWLNKVKESEN